VRNEAYKLLKLDPEKIAKESAVFATQDIQVAVGDYLLLRANGVAKNGKRLVNGQRVKVKGISKNGEIALTDGRIMPREFRQFCAGYAISSQSSQGKTVEVVLVAIDGKSAETATTKETLYVAASRGRQRCTIYTDNKKLLVEAFARSSKRKTATELMKVYEKAKPNPNTGTPSQSLSDFGMASHPETQRQSNLCQAERSRNDTALRAQRLHSNERDSLSGNEAKQLVCGVRGDGNGLPLPAFHGLCTDGFFPTMGGRAK
jgi:hypothetical protein